MRLKSPIFLFLICFSFYFVNSQNKLDIDSLLTIYKSQIPDTTKTKTLNNIINYYMYRKPSKAKHYAFEFLNLSEKINYDSGKSLALYQLGVVYNNLDLLDSSRYYYNSSLKLANKI